MRSGRAVAVVAGAALGIASLSSAATAAAPGGVAEQPARSTRLVSTGFERGEDVLRAADVSDGGQLVTFLDAVMGGPDRIYGRRPDAPAPTLITPEGGANFEEAVAAPDGSFVVYVWYDGPRHVYLSDTRTGSVVQIGKPDDPSEFYRGENRMPSVSPDSQYVVFQSSLNSLAPGGHIGLGLYVYEVATGKIGALDAGTGPVSTQDPVVSSGARYVAFTSDDPLVEGDTDGRDDVYRYDSVTRDITLVSGGSAPLELPSTSSSAPQISADGNLVCYTATAGVVPFAGSPTDVIYLTDLSTGVTQLASRARGGGMPNGDSASCDISADGELVTFSSGASDLVGSDTNGRSDIFVTAVASGATSMVSRGFDGGVSNGASYRPALSADGRYVSYESGATNLAAQDHDGNVDIFLTGLS